MACRWSSPASRRGTAVCSWRRQGNRAIARHSTPGEAHSTDDASKPRRLRRRCGRRDHGAERRRAPCAGRCGLRAPSWNPIRPDRSFCRWRVARRTAPPIVRPEPGAVRPSRGAMLEVQALCHRVADPEVQAFGTESSKPFPGPSRPRQRSSKRRTRCRAGADGTSKPAVRVPSPPPGCENYNVYPVQRAFLVGNCRPRQMTKFEPRVGAAFPAPTLTVGTLRSHTGAQVWVVPPR